MKEDKINNHKNNYKAISLPTFLLVISLLTCCVEVDISVPSFPDIANYFNISEGMTQMTIAVNFLGFCLSSILYGPLSDAWGRRKVMLVGNAIMALGACGCFMANNIEFLLISRFIQGIGASTSSVVVFAMIADVYSGAQAGRLIGMMNSLITIFTSFAPIAGSFINETIGWRGSYTIVGIISVISWIALYLWLPETSAPAKLEYRQVARDFTRLFKSKNFMYASAAPTLMFASWMIFVACSSFLYMDTYGLSIKFYALHQGAVIGAFSLASLYSGRINHFLGAKNSVIYGMWLGVAGTIALVLTSLLFDKAPYFTTLAMMICGCGTAISYPVVFSKSMEIFPEIRGTASSAIMSMRSLTCAFFVAASSYFYDGTLLIVALLILFSTILAAFCTIILLRGLSFDSTN